MPLVVLSSWPKLSCQDVVAEFNWILNRAPWWLPVTCHGRAFFAPEVNQLLLGDNTVPVNFNHDLVARSKCDEDSLASVDFLQSCIQFLHFPMPWICENNSKAARTSTSATLCNGSTYLFKQWRSISPFSSSSTRSNASWSAIVRKNRALMTTHFDAHSFLGNATTLWLAKLIDFSRGFNCCIWKRSVCICRTEIVIRFNQSWRCGNETPTKSICPREHPPGSKLLQITARKWCWKEDTIQRICLKKLCGMAFQRRKKYI